MKVFYHGTSSENWERIKKEGILFGGNTYHKSNGKCGYRHTCLSPFKEVAKLYGNILLEVNYKPVGVGNINNDGIKADNYGFNPPEGMECWQFSVFVPISIKRCRRLKHCEAIIKETP